MKVLVALCALCLCSCSLSDNVGAAKDRIAGAVGVRLTGGEVQFYLAYPQLFVSDEEYLAAEDSLK